MTTNAIPVPNVIPLCTTSVVPDVIIMIVFFSGNGAKCGTIVVRVLLLWSNPGNSAKCVSR